MDSPIGIVQITVHGCIDINIVNKTGFNNTQYLDIDNNTLFEVNNYNMILQTIKCSRIGTNYFDTNYEQQQNRNILNEFLENNTNIEKLVEKLKNVNDKISDEDFIYAKSDSEIKLLTETFHKPSYGSNKTIGKEIHPIDKYIYNNLSFKKKKTIFN